MDNTTISTKAVSENYDKESLIYDKTRWDTKAGRYFVDLELKHLIKYLKIGPTLRLGIGTAHFEVILSNGGFGNIIGIDISEGMMEKAIQKIYLNNLKDRICLLKMDSAHLGFKENTFNNVVCIHGFQWMDIRTLNESYEVLKPGGRIILIYPSGDYIFNKMPTSWQQKTRIVNIAGHDVVQNFYTYPEMEKLFDESKYKIIHHKTLFIFPPPLYFHLPLFLLNIIRRIDDLFKNGGRLNIIVVEKVI